MTFRPLPPKTLLTPCRRLVLGALAALAVSSLEAGSAADSGLEDKAPTATAAVAGQETAAALLGNWPEEANPVLVGKRITDNFIARDILAKKSNGHIVYPEACAWYGALTWAKLAGDKAATEALLKRWEKVLAPGSNSIISPKDHVDDRAFGIVPLEITIQNGDQRASFIGTALADLQWLTPGPDGLSHEARFWIDDMYMVPALQIQAWRATRNTRYLERAALTTCIYLDKLQQPNGLFLHAPDSPFYWGRGNGWFAAGMAEILRNLPPEHPRQARILAGYRKMMAALLETQASSGLWRQLLDKPESWEETSGSAMFTFAFVTGVKRGWLPLETYGPAARKAWLALTAKLDKDANLTEICVGTNKAAKEVGEDLKTQLDFYLARPRQAGDRHGQAPMLWTASALLREE